MSRFEQVAPSPFSKNFLTLAGFRPGISYDKDYLGLVGGLGRDAAALCFHSHLPCPSQVS